MTIQINGTSGISGVDGTAGTPALQGSDTNTGISFGADTVNINTGGTTRATVDSSGRVGIGTTSPDRIFHVSGSVSYPARLESTGPNVLLDFKTSGSGAALSTAIGVISDAFVVNTNSTERARIDGSGNFAFNSGYGSVATAYGCRAWVNFNGTGTVAIRASGNVSSITDNGTGDYTVNFTTAMADANYCVQYTAAQIPQIDGQTRLATGSVRVFSLARQDSYTLFDNDSNHVAIFR